MKGKYDYFFLRAIRAWIRVLCWILYWEEFMKLHKWDCVVSVFKEAESEQQYLCITHLGNNIWYEPTLVGWEAVDDKLSEQLDNWLQHPDWTL